MKLLLGIGSAALMTLASASVSFAQETIRDLRSTNTLTLSGEVMRIMGDDFVLDDGTGQILVDAESYAIRQAGLSLGDTVTVTGTYDDHDFEAISITPDGGEIIYIFDD
ncbi:MAG: DNA-binding protein [Synechococcales cyanobacterium K44_A2020_017]|uniref:OB-fold nucleic acid binding domain-containing protein n=1 Tax=Leptolyngbya sp. CCY15150 TaxID=2767772 RepID=UPI0019515AF3|nr:OB-fold nucleic acid binding domain-containing protein [Leptolyngbya sp. CCY15150]MBF2089341.1 DNA-binding protein [Synechococcales cyanobacterium K32_A2020_035]MBF2095486.1 DNA-binding protein [Synechococcales cyanobacterium K44_A2020_017]